jgi:hypothetical protein
VAFKEACKMHGSCDGLLTQQELLVIAVNTDNLLKVLEGDTEENEIPPIQDEDLF